MPNQFTVSNVGQNKNYKFIVHNKKMEGIPDAPVYLGNDNGPLSLFAPQNYVGKTNANGEIIIKVPYGWHDFGPKLDCGTSDELPLFFHETTIDYVNDKYIEIWMPTC
jgi:hypothetical protein